MPESAIGLAIGLVGAAITLGAGAIGGLRAHGLALRYLRGAGPAGLWVLFGLAVSAAGIARWLT